MDNVINLVSSDEEDNGTGVKNKIKSNKNIVPKKVRPLKSTQNVTIIYDRSTSPSVLHRPNNKQQHTINNNKQSSLSQSYKPQKILQQQPSNKTQSQQLVCNKVTSIDGQRLEGKKTVVSKSGISITAIKPQSPNNPLVPKSSINSHVTKSPSISLVTKSPYNSSVTKSSNNVIVRSNIGSTTIKPRTETVKTVVTPSPTVHVKPISPGNAAILTKPPKRVTPRKISDTVTMRASSIEKSSDSDMLSRDSLSADGILVNTSNGNSKRTHESDEPSIKRQKMNNSEKKPLHEDYVRLIEACKIADPTKDMDKIVAKLEKYYHRAHTEYINSKSFNKIVKNATDEIKAQPKQVYIKIRGLLDELRTRQSNGERTEQTIENPELKEIDEKKAKKIKKLSDALKILQEKIRKEEESEVDWDDELNSKYLLTERYKKRACEIYDKLCDLTGESRSAERMVKKPIKYNGSQFPEFNRKLEKFINKTNLFPDMFDVLRIIDYCSKEYNYKLDKDYRLTIAQQAFHDVGTLMQKRRKADLYEMVQYFTANQSDPAVEDTSLKLKLEENQRHSNKRMKEVIDRFSLHHGGEANEDEEEKSPSKNEPKPVSVNKKVPTTSASPPPSKQKIKNEPPPDEVITINDSIEIIDDSGGVDDDADVLQVIGVEDAAELEKEFLPTISSVQSLHPSEFNDFMNFSTSTKIL